MSGKPPYLADHDKLHVVKFEVSLTFECLCHNWTGRHFCLLWGHCRSTVNCAGNKILSGAVFALCLPGFQTRQLWLFVLKDGKNLLYNSTLLPEPPLSQGERFWRSREKVSFSQSIIDVVNHVDFSYYLNILDDGRKSLYNFYLQHTICFQVKLNIGIWFVKFRLWLTKDRCPSSTYDLTLTPDWESWLADNNNNPNNPLQWRTGMLDTQLFALKSS